MIMNKVNMNELTDGIKLNFYKNKKKPRSLDVRCLVFFFFFVSKRKFDRWICMLKIWTNRRENTHILYLYQKDSGSNILSLEDRTNFFLWKRKLISSLDSHYMSYILISVEIFTEFVINRHIFIVTLGTYIWTWRMTVKVFSLYLSFFFQTCWSIYMLDQTKN